MPDSVILDSSVIAAIFLFSDDEDNAAENAITNKRLITLDLSMAEVGNVAWKRVIHFQEDKEMMQTALRNCLGFISEACVVVKALDLANEAYNIAVEDKIAFYDSLFLAAAEREQVPLLTMDKKLYEKSKGDRNVRLV